MNLAEGMLSIVEKKKENIIDLDINLKMKIREMAEEGKWYLKVKDRNEDRYMFDLVKRNKQALKSNGFKYMVTDSHYYNPLENCVETRDTILVSWGRC